MCPTNIGGRPANGMLRRYPDHVIRRKCRSHRRPGDIPGPDGREVVKAVIAFSGAGQPDSPEYHHQDELAHDQPDGQPMSYSLDHKEGGRRLLESSTLIEAGVQNGDHLIVYPEVVAGARAEARG